jgi:hypothetical protein
MSFLPEINFNASLALARRRTPQTHPQSSRIFSANANRWRLS